MSEHEMREAAIQAADRAIDRIEERKGLRFNGLYDPEVAEIAEAVLTAAAQPIEAAARADERRKVAEEIAVALEAKQPSVKRFWDTNDANTVYVLNDAAKTARAHATTPGATA